eukprot:CAMPEP_0119117326 /NCGR_PEP_ID=MMETSP1180-20130426/52777_1 /TAXON_ID=3052 ORGANISM="Chlamydomonas cf sp, Strain CCMP681" /NCGR_SAMPLE_ID=MMETSP1180 /ASSEMBLY_ACC=CAM_ASM_000741 /LENGTH=170 /DNA_ID=CAMNT_0007106571 /DNA_START=82 /DNA_END=594 /DNA_ORIENTATION=-
MGTAAYRVFSNFTGVLQKERAAKAKEREAAAQAADRAKQQAGSETQGIIAQLARPTEWAAHYVVDEAKAVGAAAKQVLPDLRGKPGGISGQSAKEHGAVVQAADAGTEIQGDALPASPKSVAAKLAAATHSVIEHIGQDSEAVDASLRQDAADFAHPHEAAGPGLPANIK